MIRREAFGDVWERGQMVGEDTDDRGGDNDAGGSHYNESSGITPPSASSHRHHQWVGPIVAVCPVYRH